METSVSKDKENVIFMVSNIKEEYITHLEEEYYTKKGNGYIKVYPGTIPYIETTGENFKKYGEEIFYQRWGVKPAPWQEGLIAFIEKIKNTGMEWLLIGSCPLALRGIAVNPKGVDIVFPHIKDMEKIRNLFSDVMIDPLTECHNWVAKAYGSIFYNTSISMAFETQSSLDIPEPIDSGPYAIAHMEKINWNGYNVNIPPLELSLNINRKRDRIDRVKLIEDYMKKTEK
jgi:hypothetical protein